MEYSETCFKKRRGMLQRSLDLIEAMRAVAEAAQPITGRGVGRIVAGIEAEPEFHAFMRRVFRGTTDTRGSA
jgi:hypothetical protein